MTPIPQVIPSVSQKSFSSGPEQEQHGIPLEEVNTSRLVASNASTVELIQPATSRKFPTFPLHCFFFTYQSIAFSAFIVVCALRCLSPFVPYLYKYASAVFSRNTRSCCLLSLVLLLSHSFYSMIFSQLFFFSLKTTQNLA